MENLAPPGGILVTEYTRDAAEAACKKEPCPYTFGDHLELVVKGYYKPITGYAVKF